MAGQQRRLCHRVDAAALNGFGDKEVRTIIEISRLQYDMSEKEFRLTVIQTMADTIESYWNVALAREEVRIAEETLAMAQRLLDRESLRHGQDLSTQLDVVMGNLDAHLAWRLRGMR